MTVLKGTLSFFQKSIHSSGKILNQHKIKLTKDVYPVKRGSYATLNNSHIRQFESILSVGRVITDPSEVDSYNVDWIKMVRGKSVMFSWAGMRRLF